MTPEIKRELRIRAMYENQPHIISRIYEWNQKLTHPALDPMAMSEEVSFDVLRTAADEILLSPSRLDIVGQTFDQMPVRVRQIFAKDLVEKGYQQFNGWIVDRLAGDQNRETVNRIVEKNTLHCIEDWYNKDSGTIVEPDWSTLEKAYRTSGKEMDTDSLFVKLLYGLRRAAVEVFIEDTLQPMRFADGRATLLM